MKKALLVRATQLSRFYVLVLPLVFIIASGCKKEAGDIDEPEEFAMPISNKLPIDTTLFQNGKTSTVVVLGSSTAAGIGASSTDRGWVDLIRAKLDKDNKIVRMVNLASGGFTTFQIMPLWAKVPSARPAPDPVRNLDAAFQFRPFLIIISMPTNDIATKYSDEEILHNFKVLIKSIDSAGVDYILTGTQPRNFSSIDEQVRLETLNNKLLKAYPTHVVNVLARLSSRSFQISPKYSAGDGVHLNNKGHQVIFNYFLRLPLFQQLFGYHN